MAAKPNPVPDSVTRARRWATIDQTAEYLNCGERTVRRAIAEGRYPAYKIGRRNVRIDLNEVDEAFTAMPSAATGIRNGHGAA